MILREKEGRKTMLSTNVDHKRGTILCGHNDNEWNTSPVRKVDIAEAAITSGYHRNEANIAPARRTDNTGAQE